MRVLLQAQLGTARLRVQADVGFGDVVTPAAQTAMFPTLLDLPAPQLRTYPRETVVAEKFEAMVRLGQTNTRMKDFYDLRALAERFAFDGPTLLTAIGATFARRDTPIPASAPRALTSEFAEDIGKQAEWQGFLKRSKLEPAGGPCRSQRPSNTYEDSFSRHFRRSPQAPLLRCGGRQVTSGNL